MKPYALLSWYFNIFMCIARLQESYATLFEERPVMFGDYMRMGAVGEDRMYEQVKDAAKLSNVLVDYLEEYNLASTSTMKLVFFTDAVDHISRIARILRQPRGNALLVGVGGSGKQSLTRFACFMAEYHCFQIEVSRGYGLPEFREDVKKLYKIAGVQVSPRHWPATFRALSSAVYCF